MHPIHHVFLPFRLALWQPSIESIHQNFKLGLPRRTGRGGLMAAKKKSAGRKYSRGAGKTVASAMRRKKSGTLRSGPKGKGGKVTSRKQAIAIGLSEARKKGAKVPKKKAA
jgi:hypothetical protein